MADDTERLAHAIAVMNEPGFWESRVGKRMLEESERNNRIIARLRRREEDKTDVE